ncbi:hypothetical protein [Blastopirellula marina]|uniref:Uncharacterized protein n=1 Tax=Blastopirellula marina DSM 3645 TaxID=314230 RepID=A3ZQ09_9BACT|nr:hypothetical protein [Blastopirellula marina]EAQ81282.1 hypothetical protein DSM3645_22861 [Blastopirellula marina DSM 3645]
MADLLAKLGQIAMQGDGLFLSCAVVAVIGFVLSTKKREFFVLVTTAAFAAIVAAPTMTGRPNAWAAYEVDELLTHVIGRHWPTWTGIIVGCVIGQLAARRKEESSLGIAVALSVDISFCTSLVLEIANQSVF